MTTTTQAPVTTCPTWCEATHVEDDDLHLQTDALFTDLNGKAIEVSAFCDSRSERHGLYLGEHEISPETARLIMLELADGANLAEQAAKQAIR